MSFETISLLLNWMELGALLAILFRLGHTFDLIANTQRELRRAIHNLGDRRATELGTNHASGGPGIGLVSPSRRCVPVPRARWAPGDLPRLLPEVRGPLRVTQSPAPAGADASLSV